MLIEKVLLGISQKLPGQIFAIKKMRKLWTSEEKRRFERELEYLTEKYPMEKIIDGYIFLTATAMEEAKYFREHGEYRYHSFADVNRNVYANQKKMTLYMLGLSIAEYLWETVLRIHRFYEKVIKDVGGEWYLEIGPGHGKYFVEAYNQGNFREYVAVDVSQTAIEMTEEYIKRFGERCGEIIPAREHKLLCQDATLLGTDSQYDFIVAQEVLEHIEDPLRMLKTIRDLLTPTGTAYVLMPITAPSLQHIFLFRNVAHVRELIDEAGMEIVTEEYITANHVPVKVAEEKKLPINACLIVKKK